MEDFVQYKLLPKPKLQLFIPPPYCRTVDRKEIDDKKRSARSQLPDLSDPLKILSLVQSLSAESSDSLERKVNKFLRTETSSDAVFLINIKLNSDSAFVRVVNEKILSSPCRSYFDECCYKNLIAMNTDGLQSSEKIPPVLQDLIQEALMIYGRTGTDGQIFAEPVTITTATASVKFADVIPFYVVCFLNPRIDEKRVDACVKECFRFCLNLMVNTTEREEESRIRVQCQSLLTITKNLFSNLVDLDELLREIMSEARNLTKAERCSLFLLDSKAEQLVAKVFEGDSKAGGAEVRLSLNQGIAGYVAMTGNPLNIKDAYSHPLFYRGMDEETGFKTRSILCFPIFNEQSVVGVAQLCNKQDGGTFDYFDQEIAMAFSIYCGLSIDYSKLYKKVRDSQARNAVSNELMLYHMRIDDDLLDSVLYCTRPHNIRNFEDFSFSPRDVPIKETPCYVIKMFEDLQLIDQFKIRRGILVRFIFFVRKGYKDLPYHNWYHGFATTHFGYLVIKRFELIKKRLISNLEALALLISCLCHDIDHQGFINTYQKGSTNSLAKLYLSEGSVVERRHLAQTLFILNTAECNILENLSSSQYKKCVEYIKAMILATCLTKHFKSYRKQLLMAHSGYDPGQAQHRIFLVSLLMTCSDLSLVTKNFKVLRRMVLKICEEFYKTSDTERNVNDVMNEEAVNIPDLIIKFISDVSLKAYEVLAIIFPQANVLVRYVKTNLAHWERVKKLVDDYVEEGGVVDLDVLKSFLFNDADAAKKEEVCVDAGAGENGDREERNIKQN